MHPQRHRARIPTRSNFVRNIAERLLHNRQFLQHSTHFCFDRLQCTRGNLHSMDLYKQRTERRNGTVSIDVAKSRAPHLLTKCLGGYINQHVHFRSQQCRFMQQLCFSSSQEGFAFVKRRGHFAKENVQWHRQELFDGKICMFGVTLRELYWSSLKCHFVPPAIDHYHHCCCCWCQVYCVLSAAWRARRLSLFTRDDAGRFRCGCEISSMVEFWDAVLLQSRRASLEDMDVGLIQCTTNNAQLRSKPVNYPRHYFYREFRNFPSFFTFLFFRHFSTRRATMTQ